MHSGASRVVWLLLALGACAAPSRVTHEHHVSGTITLEADAYRVRGYDPADPRLVRALDGIEEVLGRRLVLRFNVELMPRYAEFFEYFFDTQLGKLPQRFAAWKASQPRDFAAMTAELRHIDFDYDGSLPGPKAEVGAPSERIRFVLTSFELTDELLNTALHRLYRRSLAVRYLDTPPAAVVPAERKAYLEALTAFGAAHFYQRDGKKPENEEPSGGRSEVMLRTLALEAAAKGSDPELDKLLLEQLLADGGYLRDCYVSHPKFMREVRPGARFLRAEQAWTAWALAALKTLPPEPRYALFELLLLPNQTSPRALLEPRAFPGFSLPEQGFALFDDWVRAGHPTAAGQSEPAADAKTRLYDRVLCPTAPGHRGARRTARNCRPTFYAMAVHTPDARKRLLELAAGTKDDLVFRDIALNLIELASSRYDFPRPLANSAVFDLWKRLEGTPARFRALARSFALEIDTSYDLRELLYDQATRYYRERAADRGVLLFLLARIDGYSRTDVNWKSFAATYGAPISEAELGTYLDQSFLAFEKLRNLEAALGTVSSPGSVVAARLRRYLDDPETEQRTRPMVLRGIVGLVAELNDARGLTALQAELKAYVGTDPGREREYRDALEELRTRVEAASRPR